MYAHCASLELLVLVSFFFSCEILNVPPLQPGCSKWGIVWLDDGGNSEILRSCASGKPNGMLITSSCVDGLSAGCDVTACCTFWT